jgi:hypothetical protein
MLMVANLHKISERENTPTRLLTASYPQLWLRLDLVANVWLDVLTRPAY